MNCRHCGARIGILERWRYGDFCSREHKEEFVLENARLTEEILLDLRRPAHSSAPLSLRLTAHQQDVEEPPSPELAEPAPEPDPVMAGSVSQREPEPIRPAPATSLEEAPRVKPGWKEFASLASLDRTTGGPVKPAIPPHRVLWIDEPAPPPSAGYVRVLRHPLGLPHTQYRRRRPSLRLLEILLSLDPVQETTPPAATEPVIWGGWEADSENGWAVPGDVATPYIGQVLDVYPLVAPWDRWEKWPVASPAPLPTRAQVSRPQPGPSYAAPPAPGPSFGGMPYQPGPQGMPGVMVPAYTTGPGGMLVPAAHAQPGGFGLAGGSAATHPAPAATGLPAGAMLPVAAPRGAVLATPFQAVWREMAPPPFLAQADPAADLGPLDRPRRARPLPTAFNHGRPRIFRPRPALLPPPPRVPAPAAIAPIALRLTDAWVPAPAEPARWRP